MAPFNSDHSDSVPLISFIAALTMRGFRSGFNSFRPEKSRRFDGAALHMIVPRQPSDRAGRRTGNDATRVLVRFLPSR
jgi:hypothetical protein